MENKKNGVKITLTTITPELATEYLSKNVKNRKLKDSTVSFYTNEMKKGQWKLTGDAIQFSSTGELLDGQHRLSAIIKYGQPVEMFVAEGLQPEAFEVMDTGKVRTAADVLSMHGQESANNIAAIIRFIMMFKKGIYSGYTRDVSISHSDILEFSKAHPDIEELLAFVRNVYRDFRYMPVSMIGGLYFMFAEKNQTKADEFFEKYATGVDLSKNHPVYLLRDRLLRNVMNKTKFSRRDKVALFVVCWNAFVQGKELRQLTVPDKVPDLI